MTAKKRNRTRLTIQHKLDALQMLEKGSHASAIMAKYNVSKRFVTKLKSQGDALLAEAEKCALSLKSKTLRPAKFPEIDDKVYRFLDLARSLKMPVTKDVIIQRALLVKEAILKRTDLDPEQRACMERFSASNGWAVNFVKRHAIDSVSLHGEAGSATVEAAAEDIAALRCRLREYDAECIYNVDETGLFFKLMPKRSYVLKYENRKTLRGTRQMSAKDRITAYCCTNADGSERLPLAIIGKAKNPRCFRLGSPPIPYFSNKTAWSDAQTFTKWFHLVFLPFVRQKTSKNVALLVENAGSHKDLQDVREQVTIIPLPPNVTSVHQPMDMGIIAAWKKGYRKLMVREIVLEIETRAERRRLNKGRVAGLNGMSEGYDLHMLDVPKMAKEAWDSISEMTIARCWIKANILPRAMSAEICATYGRMRNASNEDDVQGMTDLLRKLSIGLDNDDSLRVNLDRYIENGDVERWIDIENDEDIRDAMLSDEVEEIQEDMATPPDQVEREEQEEEEVRAVTVSLPSLKDLYRMFRPIQDAAFLCNLPDAGNHIHRALYLFRDSIRRAKNATQRQTLITEMFTRDP